MDTIAVLIPCFNEEKTIAKVVKDFRTALPEATVYVYDNNSTDQSARFAHEAGAVVRSETKQGKGNVVRSMFRDIDSHCYLMVDGDDTYPAEDARRLCTPVLDRKTDMVVGDRLSSSYFTENKRLFHNTGNKLVRLLINKIFRSRIQDIMSGYRAFGYEFVKTYPVLSSGFEIETEMTIHALDKNLHIENVIIEYRDRPAGSYSKLNTYGDGFRVLRTIFELMRNYRPLTFFTFLSVLLVILSMFFGIPVFVEYFKTGLVPRFPTFIASTIILLAAIQSFFQGILLDSFAKKNRQDFELNYLDRIDARKEKLHAR